MFNRPSHQEMQIKSALRNQLNPVKILSPSLTRNVEEEEMKGKPLFSAGGVQINTATMEINRDFSKKYKYNTI